MEYIIPGTAGLVIDCAGASYRLAECIRSSDDVDPADSPSFFRCLTAEVVPVGGAREGYTYEANWSVCDPSDLAALADGDISNPAYLDGVVICTDDDVLLDGPRPRPASPCQNPNNKEVQP